MVKKNVMEKIPHDQRALLVVAYSDQFEFPVTAEEVWQRMFVLPEEGSVRLPSRTQVQRMLNTLVKKNFLVLSSIVAGGAAKSSRTFYALADRGKIFPLRVQRTQIAKTKMAEVKNFLRVVNWIPWITGVFVTGSLAMANADGNDDSDFMIVTAPNRLWLSRLLCTAAAVWYGRRRSWQGEEKNSWCFNLWLDEQHMRVVSEKQTLYRAYEVTQAVPVFGRGETVRQFYVANKWVRAFLPNWTMPRFAVEGERVRRGVLSFVGDVFEWLAWRLQELYMRPHRTSEKVGRGFAFFHPRDTQGLLLDRWQKTLRRYSATKQLGTIVEHYATHAPKLHR